MQPSWLESMMSQPLQENQSEMNTGEEKHDREDQKMMKQGGSYAIFEDNSQGSEDIEAQPTLLTRMMIQPQQREKESLTKRNAYINRNCHGTQLRPMHRTAKLKKTERRQGRSSGFSNEISPLQNETYDVQLQHHRDSQTLNGGTSSVEKQSTLMSSLAISTTLPLLRRMLAASEEQKYLLEAQIQREKSKRVATGLPLGTRPSKRPRMLSRTETVNCDSGEITFPLSSQPDKPAPITNSSPLTKQSELELEVDKPSYSQTATNSRTSTQLFSFQTASKQDQLDDEEMVSKGPGLPLQTSVEGSTVQMDVGAQQERAVSVIPVSYASNQAMEKKAVLSRREVTYGMHPKYLRYNVWEARDEGEEDDVQVESLQCLADWTERAKPLPSVPVTEFHNAVAMHTIDSHPDLFKIVTPINVDRFEALLASHPNRPFVESVCRGLREGFWPWADTHQGEYPSTVDEALDTPQNGPEADFLRVQRDLERQAGRFSGSFGRDLLPGMHASPVHAVPKPHSDKLRMVINQSAGLFSPNSMIKREDVRGFPLDNMTHLGEGLIRRHGTKPNQSWVVYKSDVADAYRLLPMHPLWQIKQIVTIDGERDVDRNNCFGGRGSPGIYISFNGLVTWIARKIELIEDLWTYMDDSFGIDEEGNLVWYHRYERHMPRNQVKLLSLWDELGIPHQPHKQVFGPTLTIIGIYVNPNSLTFTLPKQALDELLHEIEEFAVWSEKKHGASWSLRKWQRLAGWINWSFNVFPLLKPALNCLYPKIAGKDRPLTKIWVNNAVREDLKWATHHMRASLGINLLSSVTWDVEDADATVFCDACMEGLAFYYPDRSTAYYAPVPTNAARDIIFYFEALAVASACNDLKNTVPQHSHIVIYTDSMNTVDIFNSLRCQPEFNPLLRHCVDVMISQEFQIRVLHIPGELNTVADAISRREFHRAQQLAPGLRIESFQPPHLSTLGAAKK